MIDISLIRKNKELVKENIEKKFQDAKLLIVDEVADLDTKLREIKSKGDELRNNRNTFSNQIGSLMRDKKIEEANKLKDDVKKINEELISLEQEEEKLNQEIKVRMMKIPNIIDSSVPIGKDDTENVELQKYGEPIVPSYEIPYHADIIEKFNG